MEEFAKSLGITEQGVLEDNRYVITLKDSDAYSKIYTLLDKSEEVTLDENLTLVTNKVSELTYFNDEYDVSLIANFEEDIYRVVIKNN